VQGIDRNRLHRGTPMIPSRGLATGFQKATGLSAFEATTTDGEARAESIVLDHDCRSVASIQITGSRSRQ